MRHDRRPGLEHYLHNHDVATGVRDNIRCSEERVGTAQVEPDLRRA